MVNDLTLRLRSRLAQRVPEAESAGGRLIATDQTSPRMDLPAEEESGGGFGGLLSRLVTPLVDVPELPGGFIGDIIEEGIEGTSSPVGLLSAALIPVTGGASLGLRGAGAVGARLATRGLAEVAVGGAAGTAAREVGERLPENTPGALRLAAALGTGVVAGGAVARGISRATPRAAARQAVEQAKNVAKAATPEADELVSALRYSREQWNNPAVRKALKQARGREIGVRVRAGEKAVGERLGGTADDLRAAFRTNLKGELPKLGFPAPELSPELITKLENQIIEHPALRSLGLFGQGGALDAFDKIKVGIIPPPAELAKLETVFGKAFTETIEALRPYGAKEILFDILNLPRAIIASGDASYHMNQGLLVASIDPKEAAKAWRISAKAMFDPAYADEMDDWVRGVTGGVDHQSAVGVLRDAGLEITGTSATPEEFFAAKKLMTRLFGGNLSGDVLRASERAYTTPANYTRVTLGEKALNQYASIYGGISKVPKIDVEDIAKTLNVLSGRGDLRNVKSGPVLNAMLFAPRFLVSRFQAPLLIPQRAMRIIKRNEELALSRLPASADDAAKAAAISAARSATIRNPGLYLSDPVLRMQAKGLGGFVAQGIAGLALIKAAKEAGFLGDNVSVELDPRSSDFGKIKIGDIRFDFWGGYSQIARTVARTVTQQTKTSSGEVRDLENWSTAVWDQFVRSKLAPIPSFLWDAKTGKNYVGDKLVSPGGGDYPNDVANQLRDRMLPLFIQDVMQGYREGGAGAAALSAPAFFGVRTTTFTSLGSVRDSVAQQLFNKDYQDITGVQQRAVDASPTVQDKERERQLEPRESFSATSAAITDERISNEDAIVALFSSGRLEPRKYADYMENQQRDARMKLSEARRQFDVDSWEPTSAQAILLDEYFNLYEQADIGWEQGQVVGEVDWDRFDSLERDFLARISPEQRLFIEGLAPKEHGTATVYFDNKDYVSESGYYEVADDEFNRLSGVLSARYPEIQSYSQLKTALGVAKFNNDTATYNYLNRIENRIAKRINSRRERLRRQDPKLDAALYLTGRTTVLQTPAARRFVQP